MAGWARPIATTLRHYVKGAEPTLIRQIKLLALLEKRGNIEKNYEGRELDWAVEYQRAAVTANAGHTPLTYDPVDRFYRASLDMPRGYVSTDAMGKVEFLQNRGAPALIKYFSQMGTRIMDDIRRHLGGIALWKDGDASGNGEDLHGILSFLRFDTTLTIDKDTGVSGAYDAADYVFNASGSYGGLSIDLGAYGGGTWAGWPEQAPTTGGVVDTLDFFTPLGVNYKSTSFGGSQATWKAQCLEATRFLATALDKDGTEEGQADTGLLDRRMFRELKDTLSTKERIVIESSNMLKSMGFGDVIELEGITYTGEFGCPANKGVVLNTKKLALHSMQSGLVMIEGPDYHKQSREYRVSGDVLGNMHTESPKYHGMLLAP